MARTVSATVQTGTGQTITEPGYLVYIDDPTTPLRYSSRGEIAWDGQTWQENGVEVRNLSPDDNSCTLKFSNLDLAIGSLILNNQVVGQQIKVYKYYNGDAKLVVDGQGDTSSLDSKAASIKVAPADAAYRVAPRIFYNRSLIPELPAPGQTLVFGDEIITLEVEHG